MQGQPIFEENDREHFKGIDIMRTVRSFDPCLPCGVHMYLGDGKKLELLHSPTQSVARVACTDEPRRTRASDRTAGDRGPHRDPARRQRGRRRGGAGAGRGAGPAGRRPLRRRAGAAAAIAARARAGSTTRCSTRWPATTWWPACCWCTACTPTTCTTRVERALEGVRPYLGSHGGDVELLEVDRRRVVRLRLLGSCDGCPSSSVTLKLAVEGAIEAAAPEITGDRGGDADRAPRSAGPVIPVDSLLVPAGRRAGRLGDAGRPGRPCPSSPIWPTGRSPGSSRPARPSSAAGSGADLFAFRRPLRGSATRPLAGATLGRRLGGARRRRGAAVPGLRHATSTSAGPASAWSTRAAPGPAAAAASSGGVASVAVPASVAGMSPQAVRPLAGLRRRGRRPGRRRSGRRALRDVRGADRRRAPARRRTWRAGR